MTNTKIRLIFSDLIFPNGIFLEILASANMEGFCRVSHIMSLLVTLFLSLLVSSIMSLLVTLFMSLLVSTVIHYVTISVIILHQMQNRSHINDVVTG